MSPDFADRLAAQLAASGADDRLAQALQALQDHDAVAEFTRDHTGRTSLVTIGPVPGAHGPTLHLHPKYNAEGLLWRVDILEVEG